MGVEKLPVATIACTRNLQLLGGKTTSQRRNCRNLRRRKDRRGAAAAHAIRNLSLQKEETDHEVVVEVADSQISRTVEDLAEAVTDASVSPDESAGEATATSEFKVNLSRAASSPDLIREAAIAEPEPDANEVAPEMPVEVPERPQLRRARTWPLSVGFHEEVSVHTITPYAEIYGMHPRYFDFGKGFAMVPAQGFGAARVGLVAGEAMRGEEEEDELSSEDDFSDFEDENCIEYLSGSQGWSCIEHVAGTCDSVRADSIVLTAC